MSDSDVMKDYVDAVIRVKVPKWQIGEKVSIYFPDTMTKWSVCESVEPIKQKEYSRCIRCGRILKNPDAKERGYGEVCWKKHLIDKQKTLL